MKADLNPIKNSTSSAFHRWQPAAWLRITGSDAAIFLQGQLTNELRGLAAGHAVYGLWLTVKGKVLADSFVLRGREEDEFWAGSYFSPAATIRERLEAFVIADDVTVEDRTADWRAVSVLGEVQGAVAGEAFMFPGRRTREKNMEIVFPVSASEQAGGAWAGLPEIGAEEMARRRVAAGIPAVPAEVGPGDLPNEAGLDAEAVSYTKGCYLGQEVMARLKAMGQVRRRLLRVRGARPAPPALPAPLFVAGRQAGELRSAVPDGAGGFMGFAMLSLLQVTGPAVALAWADGTPAGSLVDAP